MSDPGPGFWIEFTGYVKAVYTEHRQFEPGHRYKALPPDTDNGEIKAKGFGSTPGVWAKALSGQWFRVYDGEYRRVT